MRRRSVVLVAAAGVALLGIGAAAYGSSATTCPQGGTVICQATVGRNPTGIGADDTTGDVFVVNRDSGTVSTIDAMTGAVVHTASLGHYVLGPVIAERAHHVFVYADINSPTFSRPNALTMLDARSGRIIRSIPVGAPVASIAVDEATGRLFVGTYTQSVVVIDAYSSRVLSRIHVAGLPQRIVVDGTAGRVFLVMDRAVAGIATQAQSAAIVDTLDTSSLRLLRTVTVGRSPDAVAVDQATHHLFIVNDDDNTVNVLGSHDGKIWRTIRLQSVINCGRVVRHGCLVGSAIAVDSPAHRVVIVTTHDATARILDTRSGAILRTVVIGKHPNSDWWGPVAVDQKSGVVLATGLPGTVALDIKSGHVIAQLSTGGSALAIDNRLGHTFIVNERATSSLVGIVGLIRHALSKDESALYGSVTTIDARRLAN